MKNNFLTSPYVKHIFILFILQIAIVFIRKSDWFLYPQLYAEDGVVFFAQNIDLGLKALFVPNLGYIHFYPRIVALIGSIIPLEIIPAFYNYSWLLTLFLLNIYIFSKRLDADINVKFSYALTIVLIPSYSDVYFANYLVLWMLTILLIVILLTSPPEKKSTMIAETCLVIIIGLSGPVSIIMTPIMGYKLFLKRTKYNIVLFVALLLCALVQIYFLSNQNIARAQGTFSLLNIKFYKVIMYHYLYLFIGANIFHVSRALSIVISFGILIGTAIYFIRNFYKNENNNIILISGITVIFAVLFAFKNDPHINPYDKGAWYFFVPSVMILWFLINISQKLKWKYAHFIPFILLFYSLLNYLIFVYPLDKQKLKKYDWKKQIECFYEKKPCIIPINPDPWKIIIQNKQ